MQQFSVETEKWFLLVEQNISEFTSSEASYYFWVIYLQGSHRGFRRRHQCEKAILRTKLVNIRHLTERVLLTSY